MRTPFLISLVNAAADKYTLPRSMVHALVGQESNWNPWAWNPEPRYRYYWDVRSGKPFRAITEAERISEKPPTDFRGLVADPDHEWWAQAASWGLMQVMGAVAREAGCLTPYLTELCDPVLNTEYGCKHLASHLTWAQGFNVDTPRTMAATLAAYNGGRAGNAPTGPLRNADYAARVTARMANIVL